MTLKEEEKKNTWDVLYNKKKFISDFSIVQYSTLLLFFFLRRSQVSEINREQQCSSNDLKKGMESSNLRNVYFRHDLRSSTRLLAILRRGVITGPSGASTESCLLIYCIAPALLIITFKMYHCVFFPWKRWHISLNRIRLAFQSNNFENLISILKKKKAKTKCGLKWGAIHYWLLEAVLQSRERVQPKICWTIEETQVLSHETEVNPLRSFGKWLVLPVTITHNWPRWFVNEEQRCSKHRELPFRTIRIIPWRQGKLMPQNCGELTEFNQLWYQTLKFSEPIPSKTAFASSNTF